MTRGISIAEHDTSLPVLLLTYGDPWGTPKGGQATFAKHLLTAFGTRLAVSSHCNDQTVATGTWVTRHYNGTPIWFFSRGPDNLSNEKKPIIPARIKAYYRARQFMPDIREKEFSGLLLDSPELLFAASKYQWSSVCYSFAGVNNPVANARYRWLRFLGSLFEQYHIYSLSRMKPDTIIAAADQAAIQDFHQRTQNAVNNPHFYQFPTRVDTNLFTPIGIEQARHQLSLPSGHKIFVVTGRLCWIKGWDLLLDAFEIIKRQHPDALLIFVGDGEDRSNIEKRTKESGLENAVAITGFVPQTKVVEYMNAADVCLVGSHREGWSLAMCEMLACGKAIVSTDVSGARDLIHNGQNGYVVKERDPIKYAEAIQKAALLPNAEFHSRKLSEKYAISNLADDLRKIWEPIR